MKSLFFSILFLFLQLISVGQNNFNSSVQSGGIGDCNATLSGVWSIDGNIAGATNIDRISLGLSLENKFGLKKLNSKTALIAIPTNGGVFGLSVQQYGFNLYNENKMGISFSKKLSQTFNSGIKINYYNTHIDKLENIGFVSFEIGMQKELNRQLTMGAHLNNPFNFTENNTLDNIISVGLLYKVNQKVNLYTEGENADYNEMSVKCGLEYEIIDQMFLRTGYNSKNNKNTFGFAYSYKKYRVDIATYHHETLGFSSQFSLSTSF